MSSTRETIDLRPSALRVLAARYLRKDAAGNPIETPVEMFRRVAGFVAAAELRYGASGEERKQWEEAFFRCMCALEFLPNSPTLMNAGTELSQLSACFVLPVEDSMEGIFDTVKHTAVIHKSGGGTGFSFSRLRPKNDRVKSTHGISSGPVSFMAVFDAATETVRQGGKRRGANMAMLRVDHPDILEFIDAKASSRRLNNFNLSVAVTDSFMDAVASDASYDLINPRDGEAVGSLRAVDVFAQLVDRAWRSGEPGVVFIDRMNRDNPTPALGDIESTNPCGEQPLLPYESCNLGSVNLSRFVTGPVGAARVDESRLRAVVGLAVRFLDDVIDVNRYPLPEIERLTRMNRKIGLGVMGFADLLVALGIPYDSAQAVTVAESVMGIVSDAATEASRELARQRGAFPGFEQSVYADAGQPPRRHATVTTVAPTGSISIIAGTSSGVEPLFALAYRRRALDGDSMTEVHPWLEEVARREGFHSDALTERIAIAGRIGDEPTVPERWRAVFQTAHEVSPEAHVRIQAAFQRHTENAVSKTVNLPRAATPDDVERVFRMAFELGCKGVTVYRDGSRESQVLTSGPSPDEGEVRGPMPRPETLAGRTVRVTTGCGNLYVTTNENARGPLEVFAHIGKAGGCAASQTEAIGRLVSLALRSGVDPFAVSRQLRGVRCPFPSRNHGCPVLSCADAIGQVLEQGRSGPSDGSPAASRADRLAGTCADCGGVLEFEGGCVVCRECGFARC